ncbi:MAG: ribose-5-phosphate isomerase RpiA [Gemmataceae bacterium]|nr:ribose-5-phosphate isomerase RpiA [Gemmataceae bacterium]
MGGGEGGRENQQQHRAAGREGHADVLRPAPARATPAGGPPVTNADKALELVADGMTLGLGSGHAAERFVAALGGRVRAGLKVRGVPTSKATAALAARNDIPVVDLQAGPIDITFDGADEVDPALNLVKGYGNALVREKIVAAASKRLVILIGPEHVAEKRVDVLGRRGKLPIEVIPFAEPLVTRRLADLGLTAAVLADPGGGPHVTDNGNHVLHVNVGPIADPAGLDRALKDIPGVVGTGLFVGMAELVIVEDAGRVEVLRRPV